MINSTFDIAFQNQIIFNIIFIYIIDFTINNNNKIFLLQIDDWIFYYFDFLSFINTFLQVNCAINLDVFDISKTVIISCLIDIHLWFFIDDNLIFLLNFNSDFIEFFIINLSDLNFNINFDFCKFIFNNVQLFINIFYIDFVFLFILLNLINIFDITQHVLSMLINDLQIICDDLRAQFAQNDAEWS